MTSYEPYIYDPNITITQVSRRHLCDDDGNTTLMGMVYLFEYRGHYIGFKGEILIPTDQQMDEGSLANYILSKLKQDLHAYDI